MREGAELQAIAVTLWAHQRRQPTWLTVAGNSMLPLVRPGDQLWVTPTPTTYRLGDIVVYQQASTLVAHRIVARRCVAGAWCWITQGDNCSTVDAAVAPTQLLGKVNAVRRGDHLFVLAHWNWRLSGWLVAWTSGAWRRWWRRPLLRLLNCLIPYVLT